MNYRLVWLVEQPCDQVRVVARRRVSGWFHLGWSTGSKLPVVLKIRQTPHHWRNQPWSSGFVIDLGTKFVTSTTWPFLSIEDGFDWSFSDQARSFFGLFPTTEYGRFCIIPPCCACGGTVLKCWAHCWPQWTWILGAFFDISWCKYLCLVTHKINNIWNPTNG